MSTRVALPIQVVALLDIEDAITDDDVSLALPAERHDRRVIRATECGAARVERTAGVRGHVDWDATAQATSRLAEQVRELRATADRPTVLFIGGLAPLPVFFHLGYELSRWSSDVVLINRRNDRWERFELSCAATDGEFFAPHGLEGEPSEVTGRVAVVVSTGHVATAESMRQAVTASGGALAGIIELAANKPALLTPENCGGAIAGLTNAFTGVRSRYPHADGLAVFLAVPAPLAFLAGRAVNSTITRDVWVANFDNGSYNVALWLPWHAAGSPPISEDAAAIEARGATSDAAAAAIKQLQASLDESDLVGSVVPPERLLTRLREVEVDASPVGDEFSLSVAQRRLRFGRGLLEALRTLPQPQQEAVARLLFLHEVFHFDQNLLSTNYHNIGRAGVALEEVDYWADSFALTTEVRRHLRGERQDPAPAAARVLEAHIAGLAVFDRQQHGPAILNLSERRLRRYLTWHLQLARVATARTPENVLTALTGRVVAELANVEFALDARGERILRRPLPNVELVVVVDRQLRRIPKTASLDPAVLVDAVRRFDQAALRQAMHYVAEQHATLMLPWVM